MKRSEIIANITHNKNGLIPDSALYLAQDINTGKMYYCAQDNGFDITLYPLIKDENDLEKMIVISSHQFSLRFEKRNIQNK
ncbi:MAG: hypothetical protein IJ772_05460 [Bacilli bacterium]|nr:hypothetical protein [Bacilli bacterium]